MITVNKGNHLHLSLTYRNECYAFCETDLFPHLKCKNSNISLTYNENVYDNLFYYT